MNTTDRVRKQRPTNKKSKNVIITLLVLVLVIEIFVVAFTTPYFNIKDIVVAGNILVPDIDVIGLANIPDQSNLFRLNGKIVVANITSNPIIENVKLHRKIPSKLVIEIKEREAISVLNASDILYEVDNNNIPFRIIKEKNENIPLISYNIDQKMILGKPLNEEIFTAAQRCIEISNTNSPFKITEVVVDQTGELCLNISDGFYVKIGRPVELDSKMEIASQVIIQIPRFRKNGEYIDVTAPEAPAVKYKH